MKENFFKSDQAYEIFVKLWEARQLSLLPLCSVQPYLYRKNSIKPPGVYLISYTLEGGLLERGAYSRKQMTRMCVIAFQFFYPYFADSTYNFTIHFNEQDLINKYFSCHVNL